MEMGGGCVGAFMPVRKRTSTNLVLCCGNIFCRIMMYIILWQVYQFFASSSKVISKVSYPQGFSCRTNNSCYLFL